MFRGPVPPCGGVGEGEADGVHEQGRRNTELQSNMQQPVPFPMVPGGAGSLGLGTINKRQIMIAARNLFPEPALLAVSPCRLVGGDGFRRYTVRDWSRSRRPSPGEYVSLNGAHQDGPNGTHLSDIPDLMTA
jgi:hypothetical protein